MRFTITLTILLTVAMTIGQRRQAVADPCGMVPPIYVGPGVPITRVGEQQTYVFYKDGVETFVIRPGFKGKVDEFGMLIPFPTPPAVRKVPDDIFAHLAKAIDPPEVVVDLRIRYFGGKRRGLFANDDKKSEEKSKDGLRFRKQVRVISQEAVGMYEVTVLEAGSAAALKRWLDEHKYKYPTGMDKPCEDYVKLGWCFVAIKTNVGQKGGVAPKPGQRSVNSRLPAGSTFDGSVQAMGFRFKSDELVVPMRLSSFNAGELRNIVYLLTDGPRRVSSIPEEYVVRQISGEQLYKNLTDPLPLRIIGGTAADIPEYRRKQLPKQRDPTPHNGAAKDLFASDLLAISSGELSLAHEEREKQLLRVGERLGLRGSEIDKLNIDPLAAERKKTVDRSLGNLKHMTLTVIDGDFPREVLAQQNLTFAEYKMPARRNNAMNYDTKSKGPTQKKAGVLKLGALDNVRIENQPEQRTDESIARGPVLWLTLGIAALVSLIVIRRRKLATIALLAVLPLAGFAASASAQDKDDAKKKPATIRQLRNDLSDPDKAAAAVEKLVALGRKAVPVLSGEAIEGNDLARRGWAIVALSEIGGQDIDELFLKIHNDKQQKMLVRTWAAAGRVYMSSSVDALIEKASLIAAFPAVGRPIGMRIVDKLADNPDGATPEQLIGVSIKVPKLDQALAPAIMALGVDKLTTLMTTARDQGVRIKATAFVGALAGQDKTAAAAIAKAYTFDPEAKEVLWKGGPLYVPGIRWTKKDARTVVGNLIRWHLWCDRNGKAAEQRQINNNLISIGLSRVAGVQSAGGNGSTVAWLSSWGKALGRDELQKLLKEQGADKIQKYAAVLKSL